MHWHLPSPEEKKGSHHSFKALLSYPIKFRDSFKKIQRSQSMKLILEGPHNPKDEQVVDKFRELLFVEGMLPAKQFDYHTLLRFLRMRDFDLMKAKDMFLQYLKWREEFRVDAIVKEFKFEEYTEVNKCYPHGFHGVDRYGRPVYIERIGMIDLDTFLQVTSIERFVKHHVAEQEKTLNWRYPACSIAAKKHIASTTSILDVKDVGFSKFSKPARYLFMEIQKIDSSYYPETLHQLFIINAGSAFRVLWKAIRAFLDPRTLAKIQVLGTDYKSSLIEVIDPSNLPIFLGGNCSCPEYGGCLFSDKGPWNDPEIKQMLQGMLHTEEEHDCRLTNSQAYDTCSGTSETKYIDQPLLHKIQAFEPVLEDAKAKIRTLEVALEDTKSVLQELSQHIEELKQ
ncbi:Phosphatidylinositol/phosphatidylcholine transfer protein SFH11 [Abeliophyllum distichum]|uniref:Phosphatidylinositol/phosphatidylcholine transfer protein SFH11 n=1 Tax=Abeliophyllum distichum TaxID=126358 RepID=A0ABD1QCR7_9LAMI